MILPLHKLKPTVLKCLEDEEDEDNDLFNLRVLNLHPDSAGVDFYMSESDETFNEATLVGQFNYQAVIR